jgi:hypothetical protein
MTQPPPEEIWVLCRVPRAEICYLRYTLEAYEGLCVSTTVPGRGGLVRVYTDKGLREDLDRVLDALASELELEIIERGEGPA